MLSNYTYEGCIFECRLNNTYKAIRCMPWDYPIPPDIEEGGNEIRMCNSSSEQKDSTSESDLAKFEDFMKSDKSTSNCDCLPECEEESFKTQVIIYISRGYKTHHIKGCVKQKYFLGGLKGLGC